MTEPITGPRGIVADMVKHEVQKQMRENQMMQAFGVFLSALVFWLWARRSA